MILNWLGVVAGGLSVICFFSAYRAASRASSKSGTIIALLGSGILAIPGAFFSIYYTHLLPETAWFYQFRSLPATEFFVLPIGTAAGILASLLPRLFRPALLTLVILFSFVPFSKPILLPLDLAILEDRWKGKVCMQSTSSTCGAASLATILKTYGITSTEKEIARKAFSYGRGTEAWYLARVARQKGCRVSFLFSNKLDASIPYPAIVGVRIGGVGHFIPILGREGEKWVTGDPLVGKRLYSDSEFYQLYEFTGFHMIVQPPESE